MLRVHEECALLLHLPKHHSGQGFTRTEWVAPHAYAAAHSYALAVRGNAPLNQHTLVAELNGKLVNWNRIRNEDPEEPRNPLLRLEVCATI